MIALVAQLVAAIVQPSLGRCSGAMYLNGVHPNGRYTCRSVPPAGDPPGERRGIIVNDHAIETHGRITCTTGEIAYARDFRTVACRGAVVKPTPPPMTTVDLQRDVGVCNKPGCNCTATRPKIALMASCHPQAQREIVFGRASGMLELYCACGAMFARLVLAGELAIGSGN